MSLFQEGDFKGFGIKLTHTKYLMMNWLLLSVFCGDRQYAFPKDFYHVSRKIHYKIETNASHVAFYC